MKYLIAALLLLLVSSQANAGAGHPCAGFPKDHRCWRVVKSYGGDKSSSGLKQLPTIKAEKPIFIVTLRRSDTVEGFVEVNGKRSLDVPNEYDFIDMLDQNSKLPFAYKERSMIEMPHREYSFPIMNLKKGENIVKFFYKNEAVTGFVTLAVYQYKKMPHGGRVKMLVSKTDFKMHDYDLDAGGFALEILSFKNK